MSKLCVSIISQYRIDKIKAIQQQKITENIIGPIIDLELETQENPINIQEENIQKDILNDDEINDEFQNNKFQITN